MQILWSKLKNLWFYYFIQNKKKKKKGDVQIIW